MQRNEDLHNRIEELKKKSDQNLKKYISDLGQETTEIEKNLRTLKAAYTTNGGKHDSKTEDEYAKLKQQIEEVNGKKQALSFIGKGRDAMLDNINQANMVMKTRMEKVSESFAEMQPPRPKHGAVAPERPDTNIPSPQRPAAKSAPQRPDHFKDISGEMFHHNGQEKRPRPVSSPPETPESRNKK